MAAKDKITSLGLKAAQRLLPIPALQLYQKAHRRLSGVRLSGLSAALQKFLDPSAEVTIVFPPSLDWSEQLFQRPQQIASALAKLGARVLYFQHREHWGAQAFRQLQPGLVLCSAPVEVFWELPSRGLYTYALTWNGRSALAPNTEGIIYDVVDALSVFPGSQSRLESDHAAFTRMARLVLATSERLLAQVQAVRPDSLLCPNGVDYDHFVRARTPGPSVPEDLTALLADGKPLAGYIGALARWFDYPLLEAIARMRSDWEFVLIGPDHDHTLPESLINLPNVHWLGAKPYAELPAYLGCFTAGLIPFQLNPITHATSPVKLFEYMAAGKPVVSTPIHEATRIVEVLLAKDAGEFAAQLDRAAGLNRDEGYLRRSDELARQNTWERRARQILDGLHATQPSEPNRPLV